MDFLDKIILDNTVRSLIVACTIILLAIIFKRFLSHYIASFIFLFVGKRWKFITKEEFTSLTLKPLGWFIVIVITDFVLGKLNYPSSLAFNIKGIPFNAILDKIGNGAIIISFFYFIISGINFLSIILEKSNDANDKGHDQVIVFFRDLLKIIIVFIALLFILKIVFNQNIGSLLTGLSIVGAALALAARESLENLIASFIIFLDKPFFTGDTLKVNNVSGTVERIGLRSTKIRTPDKTLVTVPNKQMVDSVVDNMSLRSMRRSEQKIIVSDKSTKVHVQQLIDNIKKILADKNTEIVKSNVFFTEYSKDGVVIFIEYFTPPFSKHEFDEVKESINFSLMELMEKNELELNAGGSTINIINNTGNAMPNNNSNLL
jgi:MscS family membrane protein